MTCSGLIITPRCDFSHDKTPVVNYLPIVSVSEFIQSGGGFRLVHRECKKAEDAFKKTATEMRATHLVELGLSVSEIEDLTRSDSTTVEPGKLAKQLATLREHENRKKALIDALGLKRLTKDQLKDWVPEKEVTKLVNEMVRNNVSDVHFMPSCPPLLPSPSVLLLRHVLTSPISVLKAAGSCRVQADWMAAMVSNPIPGYSQNSLLPERILRVKSPFLESAMARFAALYGRIGVRDLDAEELEEFVEESKRECGY